MVSEDDSYLHRDFYGNRDYHGCIYSREPLVVNGGAKDTSTILFGHNMRDGSMFAGLHRLAGVDTAAVSIYAYLYTDNGWSRFRLFEISKEKADAISYEELKKTTGGIRDLMMVTCAGENMRLIARWIPD